MYEGLKGRVALVTGGSSGIGRAAALAFAREGARVVIGDVDEAGGAETVSAILAADGEARFVKCDVSSEEAVRHLVAAVRDIYGALDVAFNNAGTEGVMANTVDATSDNFRRTLDINTTGAWLCMKYEIPLMLTSGGGAIVNCSSILGLVGSVGAAAYTASKHALIGLTRAAAVDYATQRIRVNAICPGYIETPMLTRAGVLASDEIRHAAEALHPMKRLGLASEVANAAVWLCSSDASFVTGVALPVDGGYVAQ